jgi:hypothetical protein
MPKTHCTFCNKSGHQKTSCWKLNPELRPRKDKRILHVLTKDKLMSCRYLRCTGQSSKTESKPGGLS